MSSPTLGANWHHSLVPYCNGKAFGSSGTIFLPLAVKVGCATGAPPKPPEPKPVGAAAAPKPVGVVLNPVDAGEPNAVPLLLGKVVFALPNPPVVGLDGGGLTGVGLVAACRAIF